MLSFYRIATCTLALILFLLAPARAQQNAFPTSKDIQFKHITVDEGLSQTSVGQIFQDQQGFLWFGTSDGLNKYDGYEVTVYKQNPDDPNSLSSSSIMSIYEAPSEPGVLWIGTTNTGLTRFDQKTGTYTHYIHDPDNSNSLRNDHVMATFEDHLGTFWIGTWQGLQTLDRKTGTFRLYEHEMENPESLSGNQITSLYEDSAGELWVGTFKDGLNRFDRERNNFVHFRHYPDDPNSLVNNRITAITENGQGELWIGTRNGLSSYNREEQRFTQVQHDAEDSHSISSNHVTSIGTVQSEPDILWVGTSDQGVSRFNTQTGKATSFQKESSNPESLRDNRILSVLGDRSGVLWVGTYLGGVSSSNGSSGTFAHYKHNPDNPNSLSENMIWSVLEDSDGILWVGTNTEGLNRIDRTTGEVTQYRHNPDDPNSISQNSVRSLLEDSKGNIWVGSHGGLDRFDKKTNTFTPLSKSGLIPGMKGRVATHTMMEDRAGIIWIGLSYGLIRFDPKRGKTEHFLHQKDDPFSLSSSQVMALHESVDGSLWVGTWNGGLNRYNPDNNTFTRFSHDAEDANSLSHDAVLSILEDDAGCLWVGTIGGLNQFHPETGVFVRFTEQNSDLPANNINGILKGDDGNLWLSTHNGLSRLDPEKYTFRNFSVERGLQSREFNGGAYYKTRSGELLFGGINGLNAFYPEQIKDNPFEPQVALTGLSLWNESVDADAESPPGELIPGTKDLSLTHEENDITFDYVGLHYASPEHNEYAYRLDGFDKEWRKVGTRRSAIYTNIPPGDYTFRVKAANSDGVWNTKGASIGMTIHPPWWMTNWAYLGYGLSIIALVFGVDRLQRRRVVGKERERSRIREVELQAQAAEARATVLRTENERQTRELEEARLLQLSMLPKEMPAHPLVDICASMTTATEVGGDYYDFQIDADNALTIANGDATGHGANAGTMVTSTKALFNVLAEESDLTRVLRKSSRALKSMGMRKLFMALALVKLKDDELVLAGAGMPPALIYRAASRSIELIHLKGVPLGGPGDITYEPQHTKMLAGDTLLLMSDGFPELFNKYHEMLGYDKVVEIFQEVADQSPEEILAHLEQSWKAWRDNQAPGDDITFVVMKMKDAA